MALLLCIFSIVTSSVFAQSTDVFVRKDSKTFVRLQEFAEEVQISKSGLITVEKGASKKILIVHGKKVGQTEMTVKLDNGQEVKYSVTVGGKGAADPNVAAAAEAIRQIPGVEVEVRDARIFVKGRINTRGDANKLAQLKGSMPGVIVDGTQTEIYETSTVVRTINRVLQENDIANIQAHSYGSILILEGSPKDENQKKLALRIARMIAPSIDDGMSTTSNGAPAIAIEVMFVEIQKIDSKEIGINGIQDSINGIPTKRPDTAAGVGMSLNPLKWTNKMGRYSLTWQIGPLDNFLRLIQTRSASRVLSNPKLVARSGEKATFHSGGTFFIGSKTSQGDQVVESLTTINTGISLSIQPKIDEIGAIDSLIKTSISDVGTEAIDDKPTLTKSEVETAVTVDDGQTVMLTGLTRRSKVKAVSRVPLLADIPVVGELFKNRSFKERETELLILVTMSRVRSGEDKFDRTTRLFENAGDDVDFSVFD